MISFVEIIKDGEAWVPVQIGQLPISGINLPLDTNGRFHTRGDAVRTGKEWAKNNGWTYRG